MSTMTMELITEFKLTPLSKVEVAPANTATLVDRSDREHAAQDGLAKHRTVQRSPSQLIRVAMQNQDDVVLKLTYEDRYGGRTQRIVSPIRFLANDRFLAFCLCRCEPRQFQLSRCSNISLRRAADYVMPVQLEALSN